MPAYIIASIDITDPQGYEAYRQLVGPAVAAGNGKFRVRGGAMEVLEGSWPRKRVVILEFDSMQAARDWYHSETYAPAKAVRQKTAITDLLLVEGLAP
ncbi:MAG: DUF1330 domain-containing protein [Burkholderiales bacterium]|nr:DUF1330 domain-containing protein [Burkholderiales bacterium]